MSNEQTPQRGTISIALVQAIANYLGTRPFNEVHQLLAEMQRDIQLITPPAEPKAE